MSQSLMLSPSDHTQSSSKPPYGKLQNKSETATPAPESEPSYEVRAKGKTPWLEALLQSLEAFTQPCLIKKGFVIHTARKFSNKQPGDFAGIKAGVYRIIALNNRTYPEHRLMWVWFTGDFPKNEIDHINGDPLDNRIENLRDVTHAVNARNVQRLKSNTTGVNGVCYSKYGFRVCLIYNKKSYTGGTHATLKQAKHSAQNLKHRLNLMGAGFTERHGN